MKKKKIAFIAPEGEGGPHFIYKNFVDGLNNIYGNELDVTFFSSKKDWLKLHFIKYEFVFSVIPFLFKPIGAKKYIFNPRGNFELEKKNNNLGNKLLYLSKFNLEFADNIWLVSYFLADKLIFREKYKDKILIIPNFINKKEYNFGEKKYNKEKYKILTITSFKFYDKGKGILNLGNVVSKLGQKTDKNIKWTIIGNDNSENFKKIKKDFDKISFNNNTKIKWLGWCNKETIKNEFKNNDYFLYWTYLDNFPNIILESIISNMKVLVNNFESFKYFLDEKIICESEDEMVKKILIDNIEKINIEKYKKEQVLDKLYNKILCVE